MSQLRVSVFVVAAAGLAAVGCAPNPGPLYIARFYPATPSCVQEAPGDFGLPTARLDVAPANAQFFIGVSLKGGDTIVSNEVQVHGTTIEPKGRNRPILDEVVITYASPKLRGFKEWRRPQTIIFDESGEAFLAIPLISPAAGETLYNGVIESDNPADLTDLNVSIAFNGHMSGDNGKLTTGSSVFPLTVVKSTVATPCTNGHRSVTNAGLCEYPGMLGQRPYECCAPPPSGTTGCP